MRSILGSKQKKKRRLERKAIRVLTRESRYDHDGRQSIRCGLNKYKQHSTECNDPFYSSDNQRSVTEQQEKYITSPEDGNIDNVYRSCSDNVPDILVVVNRVDEQNSGLRGVEQNAMLSEKLYGFTVFCDDFTSVIRVDDANVASEQVIVGAFKTEELYWTKCSEKRMKKNHFMLTIHQVVEAAPRYR